MRIKNIFQILIIGFFITLLWGCEETVWPEVTQVQNSEYLGTWNTEAFRTIHTYKLLSDEKTNDSYYEETVATDSVIMSFQFGVNNAQNNLVADSVIVTQIQIVNGVEKAPVISKGKWTVAKTSNVDYAAVKKYINIWNPGNAHGLVALPYTTYSIKEEGGNSVVLEWQDYNNKAQDSKRYSTKLVKAN